jgi:hypothetical protein
MPVKGALFDLSTPRKLRPAEESLLEQVAGAGLPDPEPEYAFAKALGRNWRFDWCWPDFKIALEVEGGMFGGRVINVGVGAFEYRTIRGQKQHVPVAAHSIVRLGGRHNTGAGLVADVLKYSHAAILGWCVVRVTTTMVRDREVASLLTLAFRHRGYRFPESAMRPKPIEVPF